MIDYDNIRNNNKTVCLLLSGGVDSAVSLWCLIANGITPDCYYIKIGPEKEEGYNCNSDEDIEMCQWLTKHFNVKFNIIDLHKEYWDNVTTYTMDKVKNGFTPNPDVMCNTLIKFGAFYDKIGKDYDYIATGHYAQTEVDDNGTWMCTTPDPVKDQTDFLCNIDKNLLPHILFPIGHLKKEEVREIAETENLINQKRKDSQGICFLGKINYNEYIKKFLGEKQGNIIEYETGKILGQHNGHWFHTVGQRKGFGLAGGPWYCVKKDVDKNIVYVSKLKELLNVNKINLSCFNWKCPLSLVYDVSLRTIGCGPIEITFKFRHSPDYYHGWLHKHDINNQYYIECSDIVSCVASGQFAVVYDKDFHRVLGSGEITI